jgi:hypothetical protein
MLLEDGSPANETPAEQHDNVPKEVGHVGLLHARDWTSGVFDGDRRRKAARMKTGGCSLGTWEGRRPAAARVPVTWVLIRCKAMCSHAGTNYAAADDRWLQANSCRRSSAYSSIARPAGRPKIPPSESNPNVTSRPAQANSSLMSASSSSGETNPSVPGCSIITHLLLVAADFPHCWLSPTPTGRIGSNCPLPPRRGSAVCAASTPGRLPVGLPLIELSNVGEVSQAPGWGVTLRRTGDRPRKPTSDLRPAVAADAAKSPAVFLSLCDQ